MNPKQSLNAHEQVAYLRDEKDVLFSIINEDEAERFLEERNYFFKLKAFAKNFDKRIAEGEKQGRYINLDFGHLVELSRLDKQLRDIVLQLTLDIEHCLKTRINRSAMRAGVNPYALTRDYLEASQQHIVEEQAAKMCYEVAMGLTGRAMSIMADVEKERRPEQIARKINEAVALLDEARLQMNPLYIEESMARMKESPYSKDLVEKYGGSEVPYWCFLELVSFGTTISFYGACFKKGGPLADDETESGARKRMRNLLRRAQSLRNAAAHNDCLLNNLAVHAKSKSGAGVKKALAKEPDVNVKKLRPVSNVAIAIDLAAVLMCYQEFVPVGETKKTMADRLKKTSTRFASNKALFKKTAPVFEFLDYAEYLLDYFSQRFDSAVSGKIAAEGQPSRDA